MKFAKKAAVSLLGIICTATFAAGVAGCKPRKATLPPANVTTVRYALPNDGSTPAAHTGIENIGYMATVLDNQTAYHAYAHNSTKSTGYEQVTQTWKDYKGKALSGYDKGVMVCSDLSYSSLVKSGTQTCFVNDEAYMRTSAKPGKNTTPETAEWSTETPTKYAKEKYIESYGEFSTELTVYVLNEDTVESCDPVTVNDDGNFVQKFYLKENAACYYQNKMKTNGNLKGYPSFERIELTFTFDNKWQVLSSYCEEKTKIAPRALGGMSMKSTSKTTTTYYYGEEDFGAAHYGCFGSYFVNYVGKNVTSVTPGPEKHEPEILDVLGGAFAQVIGEGQQFSVDLTLGGTQYSGKIFAKLGNLNDVLNTLDVRAALKKKENGAQDLFVEFKNGDINVYYSNDFAVTANLDAVKTVAGQFSDWVKRFENPDKAPAPDTGDNGSSVDLSELLAALKFEYDETSATISLNTDNLLGTGIGVNGVLDFGRTITDDGDIFDFESARLGSITYGADSVALSLALAPDGSSFISHDPSSAAANLADYMAGVYSMLNSNTLKVDIGFDGSKQGVIPALDGLKLSASAYVALGNEIATKADISAEYMGVSAKLSAYYDVNIYGNNYGRAYLNLTEFNGVKLDAKVCADISDSYAAVQQLLSVINGSASSPAEYAATRSEESANKLAAIVNGVLSLDYGKVIGDLYASNSEIRVSADVDAVVGALGLDLNGLKFGTAALKLNLNSGKQAALGLKLAALGLDMNVIGAADTLTEPNKNEYLDATALVNIVTSATEAAKDIISAQDIVFDIDATVTADNVPMSVKGKGETIWKDGKTRVALDLTLAVADGTSSADKDTVKLKLVYDETVTDENTPFVKFAVNNLALEITRKDISDSEEGINKIKNGISLLINGEKTGNATPGEAVAAYGAANGLTSGIEDLLGNETVQNALNTVLGFASGLNVTLGKVGVTDGKVNALIINHAAAGELTLATDGNLSLRLDNAAAQIRASVKAGNGAALSGVSKALEACEAYGVSQAGDAFAKAVYNYLFAVAEDLSIENVLGDRTYEVKAVLDGTASAIDALSGIKAEANLYYTEGLEGSRVTKDKLAEVGLKLDINGTTVEANARYSGRYVYVSLEKIGNTAYNGIKFKADTDDIYAAAEQLVNIITDEKAIKTLSGLLHPNGGTTAYAVALSGDTQTALTDVVAKLLSLDFKKAFEYKKIGDENVAKIELDYILETLGVGAPALGTVTARVNPQTHEVTAEIAQGGSVWASLNAKAAKKHSYAEGWQNDGYIDIGFAGTLVKDLYNTLTDNETGELHSLYTFSGDASVNVNIKVGLNINKKIELNITTLTLGFKDGQFYFTLLAQLKESSVNLGLTKIYLCHGWNIAVTYSDGYVTFGREVGTTNAKYKVMTLDYLLDNIFVEHNDPVDSPLRWMLGMSDDVWNIIAGNVNMNSGLTKPQTYEMYGPLAQAGNDGSFYLSSILNGFAVNIGGKTVSEYGASTSAADALGLDNNYYAFDINARKLTNGLLGSLYASLLRSDEQGIYGLCASAAMSPASAIKLDININLNKYLEGATVPDGDFPYEDWAAGKSVAAPNYFDIVNGGVEGGIKFGYEFESSDPDVMPVFGCYNTEKGGSYEASNVLARRTLTVTDENGNILQEIDLAHGSAVKLTNGFSPDWADAAHTQVVYYTDENGNDLGTEMLLNADTTIKTATRAATEVIFDIGIDGLTVAGAASGELYAYPLEGYACLGWYNDKAFTDKVTDVNGITNLNGNGVKTVYGWFIKSQTTVNGVVYTINPETCEYAVTGYDTEGIKPYTVSGSTLTLENEITVGGRAYKVTSITSEAFAAMGNSVGAGLKNVIVPENIVLVGTKAFGDNYAIEKVFFLADRVGFDGGSGDKNYPFYGCSESDGGETTILELYYTEIYSTSGEGVNNENNPYWSHFRSVSSSKLRYVGNDGGRRYGAGTWSVVEFTQTGADLKQGLDCLESGIKFSALTEDEIERAVIAELNARTAKNNYVNAYNVTVSDGFDTDGKIHRITVDVTEKSANECWYALTVESAVADCTAQYTVAEESSFVLGGVTYVAAGAQISLTAAADADNAYAFDKWVGASAVANVTAMQTTLVMPAAKTDISAHWTANYAENTYVFSAVDFVYNGKSYSKGENVKLENATVDFALANPVAADGGYIFLGWALADGDALAFTGDTVAEKTRSVKYYAIWAVTRSEIDSGSIRNVSGNKPQVSLTGGGTFYEWYAENDSSFTGDIVSEISVSDTVLRARLQYTLTVNINATKTRVYQTANAVIGFDKNGEQATTVIGSELLIVEIGNTNTTKTMIYTVLEGNTIGLSMTNGTNKLTLSVSNQFELVYRARKYENSFGWKETGDRTFNDSAEHTITVDGSNTLENGTGPLYESDAVNGNVKIDIKL